jgi:rod shape-determining protein MreC
MFSKKTVIIGSIIVFIIINISLLSFVRSRYGSFGLGRGAIIIIAPFQKAVATSTGFARNIWNHYFLVVSVAKENDRLRKALRYADAQKNQWREMEFANYRLRKILQFKKKVQNRVLAAEVTGRDPSFWFKAVMIDKGKFDGLKKGMPVIIPEGIAGHIAEVTSHYSKVLLIFDQNSAIDAFVQRTRARGIIKGETTGRCLLKYVLQKHDIRVGDIVVSSGLDGVFPKGLRIGYVSEVVKRTSGIFQEVKVTPYVDFDKLEEVLVILNLPDHVSMSGR